MTAETYILPSFRANMKKRGYPHAHMLMTFKNAGPDLSYQIDEWVWAQLPSEDLADGALRESKY